MEELIALSPERGAELWVFDDTDDPRANIRDADGTWRWKDGEEPQLHEILKFDPYWDFLE